MRTRLFAVCSIVLFAVISFGQELAQRPQGPAAPVGTPPLPNSDPVYVNLRRIGIGTEALTVNNVTLKRDAGTFTFTSGTLCFLAPVEGKITGAVFTGKGTFSLNPPAREWRHLSLLTGGAPPMVEEYEQLVLRFTDDTFDVLKKTAGATGTSAAGCSGGPLEDINNSLRKDPMLKYNLSGRILQDVLSGGPGGLFVAFIKGKKYNGKMVYAIDPHGAPELLMGVAPEEVELLTWDGMKYGVWAAFHLEDEIAKKTASSAEQNNWIDIEKQDLDASFEKSGKLDGKAWTTFVSRANGLRVIPFMLYPTLRVSSVTDAATGQQLPWIQENKDEDAQFFVILPKALQAGERYSIVTTYSGKEAVMNEGQGNYYVSGGARHSWYPNSRLDDFAAYEMRFAVPKGMMTIGTGMPVGNPTNEGSMTITRWRSEQPQTVACFQFGRFKKSAGKAGKGGFDVESYANTEPPDWISGIQRAIEEVESDSRYRGSTGTTLSVITTTSLLQKALAEAQLAVPLYNEYFGPTPFKRLAVSQQTADNYGQSWPELVWLPLTYFLDTTQRHQINQLFGQKFDDPKGYFKTVAAHEIAHQWWGHTVADGSYRDQWMSEGFSEMSASLYIQLIQQKPQEFIKFWDDQRELLTEKNQWGFRPIDVGPVTMGYRLSTGKAGGDIPRFLIYPKGGYILHMVRMMMWDRQTGDARFKAMMQDFVKTYTGRAATTEDFKAMVEKHITPDMNLTGNGKMDWFFNEYVYGTALPHYKLEQTIANGELTYKITQSGVDNNFVMLVPMYLELNNGKVFLMGHAAMAGNTSAEGKIPLGQLKDAVKRASLSYYDDVLAIMDK